MLNDSFSKRLGRWLEGAGFISDPFAIYEADQEGAYLPYFFVDRPYLHTILGNPAYPQTAFLLAGRGEGKTATREIVAYECTHAQLRRRALAVRYYDFSLVLEQAGGSVSQVTSRHHLRAIARAILKALADDVPPTYFDLLDTVDRSLLKGYADQFADPISQWKLGQIITDAPLQLDWNALSPRETLEPLAKLVTHLGQSSEAKYQALYILVDRVDESAAGATVAVPLLKPLVSEGPLLEMPHVAFKFFLPDEVGQELRQTVALRPDRVAIATITWDQAALDKMVQQRVAHYSEGRVARLEDICTAGAKFNVMERLIKASEGCPRTLLRLCQALIYHHIENTEIGKTLLDRTDILETLIDFGQRLEVERAQPRPVTPAITTPAASSSPPASGLYLDEGGHVWVDGVPLSPPLSDLEFRLLHTLYRQASQIVANEALIEAVWPTAAWISDKDTPGDEQNLRKLITRVRNRLTGEGENQRSRFVQNARGRGYWLKTE